MSATHRRTGTRRSTAGLLAAAGLLGGLGVLGTGVLSGCGDKDVPGTDARGATAAARARTRTVERTTRVEVVREAGRRAGGFDPAAIYEREAPGVVTVISVFAGKGSSPLQSGDGDSGLGSGFVLDGKGEVATNAHVVADGQGKDLKRAREVYVQFADGNQVPARIVGEDPNADVALLEIDPAGLSLRPLPLGSSANLVVGSPVAAIGSPFGEPQSLSVGVISAVDRSIESLTGFEISGAIQTDAAINRGNSGGPLVNGDGEVLGINSQIQTTGGGGEGVGFAVPVDVVRRSLGQLRRGGKAEYAYLGVSTRLVYPQLAERFELPVQRGAWVQSVEHDSPAGRAGIRSGGDSERFQATTYTTGGDVIARVAGRRIVHDADVSLAIADRRPGETVDVELWRDGRRRTVRVELGTRPLTSPSAGSRP